MNFGGVRGFNQGLSFYTEVSDIIRSKSILDLISISIIMNMKV